MGRGMRLSPETGKKDCLILDFVSSDKDNKGAVSVLTFLDLDPLEVVEGLSRITKSCQPAQ